MTFLRLWLLGIIKPARMVKDLENKPAPVWGLWAVLIRFIVTSITTTLAQYLVVHLPFAPSNLTFLPIEDYYRAQIFFLPLWGIAIWLLMGSIAHLVLRISGKTSSFDRILNIIGMGMLVPMPILWLWDWTIIGLNIFILPVAAVSHSLAQLWEAGIQTIGFNKILGIRLPTAIALAFAINVIYVLLAQIFIR